MSRIKVQLEELRGAHPGRRLDFLGPTVRMGRSPDSDFAFDAQVDLQASYQHAEIHFDADGLVLIDVGSSNGTFINGRRVTRSALRDSDVIECGPGGPAVKVYIGQLASGAGASGAGNPAAGVSVRGLGRAPAVSRAPGAAPAGAAHPAMASMMSTGPGGPVGPAGPAAVGVEVPRAARSSTPVAGNPIRGRESGAPQASGAGRSMAAAPQPAARPAAAAAAAPAASPARAAAGAAPHAAGAIGRGQGELPVGQKTVAIMIARALSEARSRPEGALTRGTVFLRAMVNQAVVQSNRQHRVVIWALASSLVLAIIGGGSFVIWRERVRDRERDLPSQVIAQRNRQAIYLLAVRRPDGSEGPFCTGFAVRPRLLATNAHCVENAAAYRARGLQLSAVLNGDGSRRYPLGDLYRHPGYKEGHLSPDVGLIRVAAELPHLVELSDPTEIRALAPGENMYSYGFPGRLANPQSPEATFVQGVVGRLTTLEQTPGRWESQVLIQHSAFTTGGTSGSPIFNNRGRVVGLNAGGFRGKEDVFLDDARAGAKRRFASLQQALAGYNYGMRIDLLLQLLQARPDLAGR